MVEMSQYLARYFFFSFPYLSYLVCSYSNYIFTLDWKLKEVLMESYMPSALKTSLSLVWFLLFFSLLELIHSEHRVHENSVLLLLVINTEGTLIS